MKRFLFFWWLGLMLCQNIFSQGDIDQQKTIFYRNEKSVAFLLNSNGVALNGRFAKRKDAANKNIFDLDFAILKHPKEVRLPQQLSPNSRSFVLGKQNVVFVFRPGVGKQKEIFRKFDIGGISIRHFYSAGPSLALLKPVYYEVYDNNNNLIIRKFDDDIFNENIAGRASFFRGFSEIKPVPGAFVKFGLSFEYSKLDEILNALEVGAVAEGFAKKLPIMATKENYQFFLTLFVSYRFGKVFDPNRPKKKKTKQDFFY